MLINCVSRSATFILCSQECVKKSWKFCVRVLNKHTDLVSSVGILAMTTCLFASKIFSQIPLFIPRLSLVVLNFGGIIWLNVQAKDFIKSVRDLSLAFWIQDYPGMLLTALKVMTKGINILLTCGMFAAATVAFCGFPHITAMMYLTMRPFAIFSLATGIASDIIDYFANKCFLKKIEENRDMHSFLELIAGKKRETKFAVQIVRQIDTQVLETFQETLEKDPSPEKVFQAVKDSVQNKQTAVESNLFLITLGYISMGICRIFPDTLIETGTRWGMSLLYTDELIRQKLFQYDLSNQLVT